MVLEAVERAFGPEEWLADWVGASEVGGDRLGVEFPPEGDVFGAIVSATGEEQRRARAGEFHEVIGVGHVRPLLRMSDERIETGDDGAHADLIDELVVPESIEGRVEKLAGAGEKIEVEECVAVGVGCGDLLREDAAFVDLIA